MIYFIGKKRHKFYKGKVVKFWDLLIWFDAWKKMHSIPFRSLPWVLTFVNVSEIWRFCSSINSWRSCVCDSTFYTSIHNYKVSLNCVLDFLYDCCCNTQNKGKKKRRKKQKKKRRKRKRKMIDDGWCHLRTWGQCLKKYMISFVGALLWRAL